MFKRYFKNVIFRAEKGFFNEAGDRQQGTGRQVI